MKISIKKITDWLKCKVLLAELKPEEMELRKELCEKILGSKTEGTVNFPTSMGILAAVASINYSIDKAALDKIWKKLTLEEKACIKWTPDLRVGKFKALESNSRLQTVLTTKPATPTLTLKEDKNKDGN